MHLNRRAKKNAAGLIVGSAVGFFFAPTIPMNSVIFLAIILMGILINGMEIEG